MAQLEILIKAKDLTGRAFTKAKSGLNGVGDAATRASRKVKELSGKALAGLGRSLVRLAQIGFVAFTAAIGKAINDARKFEEGLANVFTLLDRDTLSKFADELEQGALKTMEKFGFATEEVNKALFDTISAGVEAGESIEFLDEASKLAIGGVTGLDTAVDGLTSVMNAYKNETFDAEKAASVFFTAQKFGKTTVEELANNIGKVAPLASAAGLSFEETAAAMSSLTLSGLSTEEATTGLRGTLNALIKVTPAARKEFDRLGIELNDASGELRPFGDIMKDVKKATNGNVQELSKLFPDIRSLGAVTALTSDNLEKYDEILQAVQTDTESLDQAFETQMGTFSRQLKIFGSAARVAGIEIAQEFLPSIGGMLGKFSGLLPKLKDLALRLIPKLKEGFKAIVPFLKSVGSLIFAFGRAIATILSKINFLGFLKSISQIFAGVFNVLRKLIPVFQKLAIAILPILMKTVLAIGDAFKSLINIVANLIQIMSDLGLVAVLKLVGNALFFFIVKPVQIVIAILDAMVAKVAAKIKQIKTLLTGGFNRKGTAGTAGDVNSKVEETPEVEPPKLDTEGFNQANIDAEKDRLAQLEALKQDAGDMDTERNNEKQSEKEMQAIADLERLKMGEEAFTAAEVAKLEAERGRRKLSAQEELKLHQLKGKMKETEAQNWAKWESFMANATQSKSKELQAIAKGIAIKDTIIKTKSAAMGAYSAMSGIPFVGPALGIGAALAALAFGAEQVEGIRNMAQGGAILASPGGQTVRAAEAGNDEAFLPLDDEDTAQRVQEAAGGGGNGAMTVIMQVDGIQLASAVVQGYKTGRNLGTVGDITSEG